MDVTEAIQKGYTILVRNEPTAKLLRKKYGYRLFRSHRTKVLDGIKGLFIEGEYDAQKINVDINSVPIYFGKVEVRESGDHIDTQMGSAIRMLERVER